MFLISVYGRLQVLCHQPGTQQALKLCGKAGCVAGLHRHRAAAYFPAETARLVLAAISPAGVR